MNASTWSTEGPLLLTEGPLLSTEGPLLSTTVVGKSNESIESIWSTEGPLLLTIVVGKVGKSNENSHSGGGGHVSPSVESRKSSRVLFLRGTA